MTRNGLSSLCIGDLRRRIGRRSYPGKLECGKRGQRVSQYQNLEDINVIDTRQTKLTASLQPVADYTYRQDCHWRADAQPLLISCYAEAVLMEVRRAGRPPNRDVSQLVLERMLRRCMCRALCSPRAHGPLDGRRLDEPWWCKMTDDDCQLNVQRSEVGSRYRVLVRSWECEVGGSNMQGGGR